MAKRLSDSEIEAGIAKLATQREWSNAETVRFLCGIGLVRLRALTDYAAKQEAKKAKKAAKKATSKKPEKAARPVSIASAKGQAATAKDFPSAVNAVAKYLIEKKQPGHFGDRKAFIAAVHRRGFKKMTLDAFKAKLIEANKAGAVVLSRADFPEGADPKLVEASKTPYLHAEFHFVTVD